MRASEASEKKNQVYCLNKINIFTTLPLTASFWISVYNLTYVRTRVCQATALI